MCLARTGVAAASAETPATRVRRGSVTIAVTARGDLQGGNPKTLTAPAVAQESLTVTFIRHPGKLVKAGDVVVQLDTTQQEYNLREAEADNQASDNEIALEAARNRLRQAEQDLANKKTTTAAGMAIQRAAEARIRMMADMARKNIESMTLKAKTSGYVNLQPDTSSTLTLISALRDRNEITYAEAQRRLGCSV